MRLPHLTLTLPLVLALHAQAANWHLVWHDEFDAPGLPNPARWSYESGFIRNHEAQFYTQARPENARVENGLLIIEARKEPWKNPEFNPTPAPRKSARTSRESAAYTSASLTTLGKASWTYARVEVRAKLPAGRGTWPAIWTLGTNIQHVGWPACGEIDIMEFVGHDPARIHANIHTRKFNHVLGTGKGNSLSVPDASSAFHVYAMEWSPNRIDVFVDDQKFFSYLNDGSGSDAWPYHQDQYLILNLAIGGDWGGQQGIDDSLFPHRYEIDYVRVYQSRPSPQPTPAPSQP